MEEPMFDLSQPFSRRRFLAGTSCFGAFYALAKLIPVPALAADVAADARVSEVPLVDKGFASVRKIGNGLYATISDPSKGTTTYCNGGFLVGRDAALLVEAFTTSSGASFQLDGLQCEPGAGEGGPGYPLPFRPLDGKCILRRT